MSDEMKCQFGFLRANNNKNWYNHMHFAFVKCDLSQSKVFNPTFSWLENRLKSSTPEVKSSKLPGVFFSSESYLT